MSVNSYDFPSALPGDAYRDEKWFLRDQLNLAAEALAQLKAALDPSEYSWYEEGLGTRAARLDYTRERLRLLYVGITRARRELSITANTGRFESATTALPLLRLIEMWRQDREQA
jgi:DNA helicase-2/ATP-dependent DNA helicase PcrA